MAELTDDVVEVYRTDSTVEAHRVLDTLLAPAGIRGLIRDRMDHALPAPASQPGQLSIAVAAPDAQRAIEILKEAEEDGYIDHTDAAVSSPTEV
jgi:hypothetical protein